MTLPHPLQGGEQDSSPRGGWEGVDGQGGRPVLTFCFGNDQFAVIGTKEGGSLADAGCAHVFCYGLAGVGYVNLRQFLGSEK